MSSEAGKIEYTYPGGVSQSIIYVLQKLEQKIDNEDKYTKQEKYMIKLQMAMLVQELKVPENQMMPQKDFMLQYKNILTQFDK